MSGARRPARPTAVTLVTGFLGAGKTSAIRRWIGERPPNVRWAVLVNDFGVLAIDAAAFDGAEVHAVAGGCACCTAAGAMRVALGRVLRRGPWERIFVELSGLGNPAALVDALRSAAGAGGVRVDGVIAVVDALRPSPWLAGDGRDRELAQAQIDAAGAIVLSHTGAAPREPLERLEAALAAGVFGPRPVLRDDETGPPPWPVVARALGSQDAPAGFEAPAATQVPPDTSPVSAAVVGPSGALPSAVGRTGRRWRQARPDGELVAWHWPAEVRFDRRALLRWAEQAASAGELLRAKGAFRTEREWYLWQHAGGSSQWAPTAWRRDNRVECLFRGPVDASALDRGLLTALAGD